MNERNYVVVGGTSGIGLSIVKQLSEKGHDLSIISRGNHPVPEMENVRHLEMDVVQGVDDLADVPGKLQGLVYCPGSIRLRPFQRLTPESFIEDYRINVMGAVNVIQAVLSRLKKSPTGASIVLFSTVAVQTGMPFHASIGSAKGALEGLTRSLAAELAPRIRVNALAPSLTDTPLAGQLLADSGRRKQAADRHPLKRVGIPADLAAAAVFLLEDSSSWVTGQVLAVDGGMGAIRLFR